MEKVWFIQLVVSRVIIEFQKFLNYHSLKNLRIFTVYFPFGARFFTVIMI